MDVSPNAYLGPFTGDDLPADERGPQPVTEEVVREHCLRFPVAGVSEHILLIHSERAIRLANKAYNNRRVMVKNAMTEFKRATGIKPIQAKDEVWLPEGRKIGHMEFITDLRALIEEYRPCSSQK